MPSPFPGMDPYLEGSLWRDVHQALATKIRQLLAPRLKPRYVARLEISIEVDESPEEEIGMMYPDVEVITVGGRIKETTVDYEVSDSDTLDREVIPPAPLFVPLLGPVKVRLITVEIRTASDDELVTVIEILSPVNKRGVGLTKYRQKQRRLREAGIHLLEIDLLRRGTRPLIHPHVPQSAYLITLTRARANQVEVWPLKLQDTLPLVSVPLRAPDPDAPLNLSAALTEVYNEAVYDLSINYHDSPPSPSFSPEEEIWLKDLLQKLPIKESP